MSESKKKKSLNYSEREVIRQDVPWNEPPKPKDSAVPPPKPTEPPKNP